MLVLLRNTCVYKSADLLASCDETIDHRGDVLVRIVVVRITHRPRRCNYIFLKFYFVSKRLVKCTNEREKRSKKKVPQNPPKREIAWGTDMKQLCPNG
jgi:hypothetical protein